MFISILWSLYCFHCRIRNKCLRRKLVFWQFETYIKFIIFAQKCIVNTYPTDKEVLWHKSYKESMPQLWWLWCRNEITNTSYHIHYGYIYIFLYYSFDRIRPIVCRVDICNFHYQDHNIKMFEVNYFSHFLIIILNHLSSNLFSIGWIKIQKCCLIGISKPFRVCWNTTCNYT